MFEDNAQKKECMKRDVINFKTNFLNLNSTIDFIDAKIKQRSIMVFAKSYSPECTIVIDILLEHQITKNFEVKSVKIIHLFTKYLFGNIWQSSS